MDASFLRKVDDLNTPNESGAFVYIIHFIPQHTVSDYYNWK